jgi:uncharacterized protein YpbB
LSEKAESIKEEDLQNRKNAFLFSNGGYSDSEWEVMQKRKAKGLSEKISSKEITVDLVNKGMSLAEAAKERNLKESTLLQHLLWAKNAEIETHFDHLRPDQDMIDAVTKVVKSNRNKEKKGNPSLTELKSNLNHRYSFEEIKKALLFVD